MKSTFFPLAFVFTLDRVARSGLDHFLAEYFAGFCFGRGEPDGAAPRTRCTHRHHSGHLPPVHDAACGKHRDVRARLRKAAPAPQSTETARFNGWTAHFDRYLLVDETGSETTFSHAEGEVLRLFLERPKRLISRANMQESLGGAAGGRAGRRRAARQSAGQLVSRADPGLFPDA